MPVLQLKHTTTYRYSQPASFGEHRLMVRPRESYDQRLLESSLIIDPEPSELRWLQDVFGNSVAIATFARRAKQLHIENKARLIHLPHDLVDLHIEDYARHYPFTYASEEMPDLLRSIERQHLDPHRQIDNWARRFVNRSGKTDTLGDADRHDPRDQKRVHLYAAPPKRHADADRNAGASGQGTCRDYAMLMIEAVRALGSGGPFRPRATSTIPAGSAQSSDGAWLAAATPTPGCASICPAPAGSNSTPPTRSSARAGLIRVAVARDIYQAVPISGIVERLSRQFPGDGGRGRLPSSNDADAGPDDAPTVLQKATGVAHMLIRAGYDDRFFLRSTRPICWRCSASIRPATRISSPRIGCWRRPRFRSTIIPMSWATSARG